jgi:hypothetical protein
MFMLSWIVQMQDPQTYWTTQKLETSTACKVDKNVNEHMNLLFCIER